MKRLLTGMLIAFVVFGTLAGCGGFGRGHGPVDAFQFLESRNPGLGQTVTGVLSEGPDPAEILVVIPPGTENLNLVATFSLNARRNARRTISASDSFAAVVTSSK